MNAQGILSLLNEAEELLNGYLFLVNDNINTKSVSDASVKIRKIIDALGYDTEFLNAHENANKCVTLQDYANIASMDDLRALALEFALQKDYTELDIVTKKIIELTAQDKVEVKNVVAREKRSGIQEADKDIQETKDRVGTRKRIGKNA